MAETMTPNAFAAMVDSNGREVRKFLRAVTPKDEHPGKGARWSMPSTKRELNKLTKQFNAWREESAKPAPEEPAAEVEVDDETEPTDAELQELEVED